MNKPEKFKCTEPGCTKEYNDNAHLGIHRRAAHGIQGKSHNAVKKREERAAAKAAATAAQTKRTYKKRSNTLATIPEVSPQSNGYTNGNGQATSRRFHAEAALAVAFGRFKELCASVAFEYDLPPRSFTSKFIELIHSETLR